MCKQHFRLCAWFFEPNAVTLHAQLTRKACFAQHKCLSRMIFTSITSLHNIQTFAPHPVSANAYACNPLGCAAAQLWYTTCSAGTDRGNVSVPISQVTQQAEEADLPNVHLQAGCNIQHGATSFCRACLGVQRLPHASRLGFVDATASQSDDAQSKTSGNHMLVTTSDGQVFATSLVDSDRQTGQLEALQRGTNADGFKHFTWSSSLSAASVMQMQQMDVARCVKDCIL